MIYKEESNNKVIKRENAYRHSALEKQVHIHANDSVTTAAGPNACTQ